MFECISVGTRKEEWKNLPDGYLIDYRDSGFVQYVFMDNISESEMAALDTNSPFEIRFSEHHGVGFFSVKYGDLPWGDCSFHPSMCSIPVEFPELEESSGIAFNVVVVDTSSGEVKKLRLIGLGHRFSLFIKKWCEKKKESPLSESDYKNTVRVTYVEYSSAELAQHSLCRWKKTY